MRDLRSFGSHSGVSWGSFGVIFGHFHVIFKEPSCTGNTCLSINPQLQFLLHPDAPTSWFDSKSSKNSICGVANAPNNNCSCKTDSCVNSSWFLDSVKFRHLLAERKLQFETERNWDSLLEKYCQRKLGWTSGELTALSTIRASEFYRLADVFWNVFFRLLPRRWRLILVDQELRPSRTWWRERGSILSLFVIKVRIVENGRTDLFSQKKVVTGLFYGAVYVILCVPIVCGVTHGWRLVTNKKTWGGDHKIHKFWYEMCVISLIVLHHSVYFLRWMWQWNAQLCWFYLQRVG